MEQRTEKRSFKKPLLMVGVFLLVVSLAANGYLAMTMFGSGTKVATGSICGDDIIEKYNKLYSDSASSNEQYSSLLKDIESKEDYKEDINCAYLSYIIKNTIGQYSSEYYKMISEDINKGKNPSLKINNIYTLNDLKKRDEFANGPIRGTYNAEAN